MPATLSLALCGSVLPPYDTMVDTYGRNNRMVRNVKEYTIDLLHGTLTDKSLFRRTNWQVVSSLAGSRHKYDTDSSLSDQPVLSPVDGTALEQSLCGEAK